MSNTVATEKKLQNEEAVNKFKKLVKEVNICMFTTISDELDLFSRPMATIKVDDDGNAWFFTNEFSEKVHEISKDNSVYLIYSNPRNNTYVYVKGTCTVVVDRTRINDLWSPSLKAWFPEGTDDPKLCLLKVVTSEAFYWDHAASNMSVFFSMMKAIANKSKVESGEIGKLKLG
ncbi:MAG TPA: pyridoxamine 5'-phosphate oxidase family protein [Chitinophagaceae bacterium]|nr:pyridoxamine 5'-phosphate oxidase family protein [Chitinophagaceae bacterium]